MASTKPDSSTAPQPGGFPADHVDYHSKLHPDVQRGLAEGREEAKPVIDVSSLGAAKPFSSDLVEPSRSVSLEAAIAEEDEDYSSSDSDSEGSDNEEPFVVNGSGDPKQNKYPHPTLGQISKTDGAQTSEVLTASLIEIRKHPGTFQSNSALYDSRKAPQARNTPPARVFVARATADASCAPLLLFRLLVSPLLPVFVTRHDL